MIDEGITTLSRGTARHRSEGFAFSRLDRRTGIGTARIDEHVLPGVYGFGTTDPTSAEACKCAGEAAHPERPCDSSARSVTADPRRATVRNATAGIVRGASMRRAPARTGIGRDLHVSAATDDQRRRQNPIPP